MKYTKTMVLATGIIIGSLTGLYAQEGTVTSGGEVTGTGGSMSFTVGQMDYIEVKGNTGAMHQGIQHPFEVSVVSDVEEPAFNGNISIYPNPTQNMLTLSVTNNETAEMSYSLFDIKGQLITSQKLSGNQTNIQLTDFAASTYIIKVMSQNTELKSFRIIKN